MNYGLLIFVLLLGLALGAGLCYLWLSRRGDGGSVTEVRRELGEYRQEVTQHYLRTAELVDRLTEDYKAVFDHLNAGALRHMDPEALRLKQSEAAGRAVTLGTLGQLPDERPGATPSSAPAQAAERRSLQEEDRAASAKDH